MPIMCTVVINNALCAVTHLTTTIIHFIVVFVAVAFMAQLFATKSESFDSRQVPDATATALRENWSERRASQPVHAPLQLGGARRLHLYDKNSTTRSSRLITSIQYVLL